MATNSTFTACNSRKYASRTQSERLDQYTLWQMIGIWAARNTADGAAGMGSHSCHHPLRPAASRHHLLVVDHRRYGMGICRSPGDPLPRARHAALERHPTAPLVANPTRSKDGQAESKAVLVGGASLTHRCPGDCRTKRLSGCTYSLAVSWCGRLPRTQI